CTARAALLATPAAPHATPCGSLVAPAAPPTAPCGPPAAPRPASRPSCSLHTANCSPLAAPCCCLPCSLRCPAPTRPAYCAAMASLHVLAFDDEGRPIQFDKWLDDLQLYLLSHSRDSVSMFDHTSGASPAPPVTADSATLSQWLTREAAARLAIRNHLPGVPLPPLPPSYASAAAVDVLGAEDVGAASASGKCHSSKGKDGMGGGSGSGGGGGGSTGGGGVSGGGGDGGSGGGRARATQWGGSGNGQRQQQQRRSKTPSPQQLREWFAHSGASGGSGSCPYVICTGERAGQTCGKPHTQHSCFSRLDDAWRAEFGDEAERPHWVELLRSGVSIFDLDYDAILAAMYALSVSAEGDCYLCVQLDPGIEAAALGASESAFPGTTPAEALHTFTLDSGASCCFFRDSTTLTDLFALVPVRLAEPLGGPVLARSSTFLLCSLVLSGSLCGLHLPSFSTNLVSTAALQNAMVTTTTPRGQRVSICTCTRTGRHLATFTRRPGSSLYTLAAETSPGSYLRRGVRVRSGISPLLVSPPVAPDSPLAPPPWSPLPATPSWHALPPPFRLQHRERFREDLPVLCLHSDRGGEFSSDLLRYFCHGDGLLQSFTLPASPQQNGIAERYIGLVMEVARTSMIHAAAPHFLWPFAVRYAAHQLNLWPRVSLPETSSTLRWIGEVGDASVFWVWGSRAFVHDTPADKLSARAISCVFLGFPPDTPGWQFYHPTSRRVLPFQDVTFDEPVPFYRLFPYRSAPPPPLPLFLALGPPAVDPLIGIVPVEVMVNSGAARGAASGGAESGGVEPGGAESEGAGSRGAEPGGAEPAGAEPAGVEPGGLSLRVWSLGVFLLVPNILLVHSFLFLHIAQLSPLPPS
ncbi:unnamed protein product, partial [Closterium sp. NIES-54]